MAKFETIAEVTAELENVLAGSEGDYNVKEIAHEAYEYDSEARGFVPVEGADFWEIAAKHAK